jgi:hypothetical protein
MSLIFSGVRIPKDFAGYGHRHKWGTSIVMHSEGYRTGSHMDEDRHCALAVADVQKNYTLLEYKIL